MKFYYFHTKHYLFNISEFLLNKDSISLNFKNLNEIYEGINCNNLIIRSEAKFTLKIHSILENLNKEIKWHGISITNKKKIYENQDLNLFNGKDSNYLKASSNPKWFNNSFFTRLVKNPYSKNKSFKIVKDIFFNKLNQKNTLYLLPWIFK